MRRLLSHPVVHFLLLGSLLGGVVVWLSDARPAEEKTIRITSSDLNRMKAEWAARWNRPPTRQEFEGLLRANVRERVLHREALRLGLDRDEPVVRRVLVQKLERIADDLIELSLAPTDQELEESFRINAERYRPEPLITLTQVYIDPNANAGAGAGTGGGGISRAEALIAELARIGEPATARADAYGDRLMIDTRQSRQTRQRIAALFGSGFADSVFELPPGAWSGPVESGYGLHAVFVHELETFPLPAFSDIRDRVRQDWVDEKRREISEKYYDDLLAGYAVVIDDPEAQAALGTEGAPES